MRVVLLCIISTVSLLSRAQDTLVTWEGKKIPVIIVKSKDYKIKYKKPGADATIYSAYRQEIAEVRYANGFNEKTNPEVRPGHYFKLRGLQVQRVR